MDVPKTTDSTLLDAFAVELAKGRMGAHVPDAERIEHARHAYRDAAALLSVRDEMHDFAGKRLDQVAAAKANGKDQRISS